MHCVNKQHEEHKSAADLLRDASRHVLLVSLVVGRQDDGEYVDLAGIGSRQQRGAVHGGGEIRVSKVQAPAGEREG